MLEKFDMNDDGEAPYVNRPGNMPQRTDGGCGVAIWERI